MLCVVGLLLTGIALIYAPVPPSSFIAAQPSTSTPQPLARDVQPAGRWLPFVAAARVDGWPRGNRQSAIVVRQFLPGQRVLLDAHNAYPDRGRYADRLDAALATGVPVAVEQDLAWCRDRTGVLSPVVSHEASCVGGEPTLEAYFFERIRPIMERALAGGPTAQWPLVTLNLDFKTNEPEHHAAVWALLGRYERWLTTAPKLANAATVAPLQVGPLLVLTGSPDVQQASFHDAVAIGSRLRLFGAIAGIAVPDTDPSALPRATPATNYRRWWNHPWKAVEPEGQRAAGDWTEADAARLRALVTDAHVHGLWIRVYTLNGLAGDRDGWTASYNFGSPEAVERRWRAAVAAHVDFIATDQYAEFARARRDPSASSPRPHLRDFAIVNLQSSIGNVNYSSYAD